MQLPSLRWEGRIAGKRDDTDDRVVEAVLIEHLESRLGRIQRGWTKDLEGVEQPFQVTEHSGVGQFTGSTWYSTLGLSRHILTSPRIDGAKLSTELIICTHSALAPARLPQAIQLVANRLLRDHEALLRGDTFNLPGTVANDSDFSTLYATDHLWLDDDFGTVEIEDQEVTITQLMPISDAERQYAQEHGWHEFERQLVQRDPDLFDLCRPSLF